MASWAVEQFGATLVTKDGNKSTSEVLQNKKVVGIYFSAHWCPPCRGFTPVLAEFYSQLLEETDDSTMEIIFISSDSDAHSFAEYYGTMPWTAVPFSNTATIQSLGSKYAVRGIPSFIVVNGATGEIVDKDARSTVAGARGNIKQACQKWGV